MAMHRVMVAAVPLRGPIPDLWVRCKIPEYEALRAAETEALYGLRECLEDRSGLVGYGPTCDYGPLFRADIRQRIATLRAIRLCLALYHTRGMDSPEARR